MKIEGHLIPATKVLSTFVNGEKYLAGIKRKSPVFSFIVLSSGDFPASLSIIHDGRAPYNNPVIFQMPWDLPLVNQHHIRFS